MSPSQQPRHVVTAVVVAHDGARLLPGLVRALRTQTYPIQRCVGADTGSADSGGLLLAELIGHESVLALDRSASFAAAVAAALRHPAASTSAEGVEWVWLLHDDCEPAPDALEKLLRAAVRDRGIAVVGPKIRDLTDRRVLREAGVTVDRAGRRVTGIEPGEIDQGQHDGNRGALAVSSAGMLIRRDVWEQVGGFDELLTMFRDDVDFCWRVHAAGYRVQVVTDAVLYHRELGARRAPVERPRRLDRRNALYVFAANLPLLAMVRILGGCMLGSLLRAGWFVLTKQNDRARDHLAAITAVLGSLRRARRGRRRVRKGYPSVRGFILPARTLRKQAEKIAGMITAGPTAGGHSATEDPEDEQFTDEPSVLRRVLANPGVRLVAVLTAIALVAERRLLGATLGGGTLGGGALVPAWAGASGLWRTYLAGFHAAGIGSSAIAPPYLAVVAALSTLLAGKTWLAVDVLLLGSVPLAGLTAYLAARRVTSSAVARVTGAAAYSMAPVAMGAVAAGRLGTSVAIAAVPLVGLAAARVLRGEAATARRAAWATGLTLGVAAAFVPALWPIGVVLAAACYVVRRSTVNAAIVALTPAIVLFPWSLSLLRHPGSFLLDAGAARASAQTSAGSLLMLRPGGPGLPPVWVTAGFALALLALLVPHRRGAVTRTGWAVAIADLAAATLVRGLHTWPGPELAVASAGLVLAALPAAEWLTTVAAAPASAAPASAASASAVVGASDLDRAGRWRQRPQRLRRLAAVVALAAAASAPALAAAFWVADGVQGPVEGVTSQVLPAFVAAASEGPGWPRTLVLRESGGVITYAIDRQADPSLGEPGLTAPAPASDALSGAVAALGADEGDPGQALSAFAIKWVLLPGPVDAGLAQRLDGAAGLSRVSTSAAYDLWEVAGTVARARVIEPDGTVIALPSGAVNLTAAAPSAGGTLLLAEPAGGWTATLDGRALRPRTVAGWEQAFTLPAGGGSITIDHNDGLHHLSNIIEAVAVLVVLVLALPGKRAQPVPAPDSATGPRPALEQGTGPRHALGAASRPRLALGPAEAKSEAEAGAVPEPVGAPSASVSVPATGRGGRRGGRHGRRSGGTGERAS